MHYATIFHYAESFPHIFDPIYDPIQNRDFSPLGPPCDENRDFRSDQKCGQKRVETIQHSGKWWHNAILLVI